MENLLKRSFDIGYMDTLAAGNTFLHKLDPGAKLITTIAFIVMVVSYNKYTIAGLLPFAIYPAVLIAYGGLPVRYLFGKILLVAPLAISIGIFNPLMDTNIVLQIGSHGFSGGWVSFVSIIIRFLLTVTASLVLISLTGFNSVCESLLKFGVPKPFVVQLLFFYRYLFVLSEEAFRMARARSARSFNSRTMRYGLFISLIGQLLLRTLDRAERIYQAMCCRGFNGHTSVINVAKSGYREVVFVGGWIALFVVLRLYNLPQMAGDIIQGVIK